MNKVYEQMKNLVPVINTQKYRDDGEFLIIMSYSHKIQYLNEVAREFFLQIDGKDKVEDIVAYLLEEYEVSEEELTRDIVELIRDLQWNKMIMLKEKEEELKA